MAGNIKWDSKNSLTEDEIVSKYELGEERKGGAFSTYINGKHDEMSNNLRNKLIF